MSKVDILQSQSLYLETPSELEFPNNSVLAELCGAGDINLQKLEYKLSIQISRRGNILSFSGDRKARENTAIILNKIFALLFILQPQLSFLWFVFRPRN